MSSLQALFQAHTAAIAAWDAIPDDEWDQQDVALGRVIDLTRDALLLHRPMTLAEVAEKAAYMATTRSFCDWDDFPAARLIHALTPIVTTCTQDGTWLARCPCTGLVASGATLDEAVAELQRILAIRSAG
ncbi:hypothetical protein [Tianweitania sp.]|uniref:type II toxin-antitoxin system HicB family antitoxin n=1 Tax=Tianweitania sp. TaxID=2021634 RepID=UPI00289D6384|nr:hypothetical protein [Tianweitania sp.]